MNRDPANLNAQLAGSRIVFGVFGFAFAGIGLTVLGFLWLTPFNQFGSPPLFFRIFGSFVALCFVAMGGTTFVGAILGNRLQRPVADFDKFNETKTDGPPNAPAAPLSPLNYCCSNCGAKLAKQSDVSPLGDVKCSFCHQWFNIHRPASGT
jgi:hypothetical protein